MSQKSMTMKIHRNSLYGLFQTKVPVMWEAINRPDNLYSHIAKANRLISRTESDVFENWCQETLGGKEWIRYNGHFYATERFAFLTEANRAMFILAFTGYQANQ